jgi:peptidyl-prolyl cis-trans isomerase SurA
MMKKILLLCTGCLIAGYTFSQPLLTYGTNEVSKDEFIRAFNKNITHVDNKEKSMKEYLELYAKFKLKVKTAKELKLDTLEQLKYDMLNFRKRLENDYPVDAKEALAKTNFKRNPSVKDEELFRFSDSVTLITESRKYPIGKEVLFTMAGSPVKVNEWLNYVKDYKLNYEVYKGENYNELLEKFIATTVTDYFRKHMEEYNPDFKYQLQEFKEGNLFFEVMSKKVWNKSTNDQPALKGFYETNKDHFVWVESADVILVNAKYFAYADYASENMKNGQDWKKIAAESENMIQADSGRYEISQLPVKPGTKLTEGAITEIVKSKSDNGAGFIKVLKVYPARLQRSFDEAKSLVINEYQKQLEESWMSEMTKKYPVKINNAVLQSLLK